MRFSQGVITVGAGLALATGLSVSGGRSASTTPSAHRGGTMVTLTTDNPGSVDPAINYGSAWNELNVTNDGLLAFRKVGGAAGNELVPDLAVAVPKPSRGGRTYTFRVRRGIRYSNGTPLRPSDFEHVFERMFRVLGPTAGSFYSVLVGGRACVTKPKTCSLQKGVVANDAAGTVTFNLTRPDGEFLQKLAVPFAFAVPPSAPDTDVGTKPLPGTGPYRWAEYTLNRQIRLERNPFFKEWSRAAQPDGYPDVILRKLALPIEAEITQVQNSQADAVLTPQFPPDRLGELSTRFASQTHVDPLPAINYIALNTRVAPFDNLDVRRALNFATDRAALVKIFGGPRLAVPSCQVLPPAFPGYKPYCPYTKNPAAGSGGPWKAPDLAKARALIARSGTKGQKITIVMPTFPIGRSVGLYFQRLLDELGYKASLKLLAPPVAGPLANNSRNKVQMTLGFWSQDYPAASDFLHVLTSCAGFIPNSDANPNVSEFCDRKLEAKMDRALALGVSNPRGADAIWTQVDREVTDAAPLVTMINPKLVTFVSKRVGNFQFNPSWYWLMSQSWVQ